MKRTFGSFLSRLLLNGTTLTEVEFQLLQQMIDSLPITLRSVVEAQFNSYNLVQRECDGRALNFYRKVGGQRNDMDGLPLLNMTREEATLIRLTATVAGDPEAVHATLTAVNGRVFCMNISRPINRVGHITVLDIKASWKTSFDLKHTGN